MNGVPEHFYFTQLGPFHESYYEQSINYEIFTIMLLFSIVTPPLRYL